MAKTQTQKIGLIGLGTMGSNLALNIARHGFSTAVYNRTTRTTREFIAEHKNENLVGYDDLKNFVEALERPRKIILMVSAGQAIDALIETIAPLLQRGDSIIDGGNSHYKDTIRRAEALRAYQIEFVGLGISGGEHGALTGPSMMFGGSTMAWQQTKPILEKIAARDFSKKPTLVYCGTDGAGHFVKMVHNGIEYAIMQLIAEVYDFYRTAYRLKADAIADIFQVYNRGELESYLFEITQHVLRKKDDLSNGNLIDKILDQAGQKGTGLWSVQAALEYGVAVPSTASAIDARVVSNLKTHRVALAKLYGRSIKRKPAVSLSQIQKSIASALQATIAVIYIQNFELLTRANQHHKWNISLSAIARAWQGGCIIRSQFLKKLAITSRATEVEKIIKKNIAHWQQVITVFNECGIPAWSMNSAAQYFYGITQAQGAASLIQGLRDNFGAHGYQRIDRSGDFHTEW